MTILSWVIIVNQIQNFPAIHTPYSTMRTAILAVNLRVFPYMFKWSFKKGVRHGSRQP